MSFLEPDRNRFKFGTLLVTAILIQALIIWLFFSGLTKKINPQFNQLITATLIEEIKHIPKPEIPKPKVIQKVYVAKAEVAPPKVSESSVKATVQVPLPAPEKQSAPSIPVVASTSARLDSSGGCQRPQYPEMARFNGDEGIVIVGFLISVDGRVKESKVLSSSGHKSLDSATRDALSLCKFQAGSENGQPIESWAKIKYEWRLSKN
jgi:TonB family protein